MLKDRQEVCDNRRMNYNQTNGQKSMTMRTWTWAIFGLRKWALALLRIIFDDLAFACSKMAI